MTHRKWLLFRPHVKNYFHSRHLCPDWSLSEISDVAAKLFNIRQYKQVNMRESFITGASTLGMYHINTSLSSQLIRYNTVTLQTITIISAVRCTANIPVPGITKWSLLEVSGFCGTDERIHRPTNRRTNRTHA